MAKKSETPDKTREKARKISAKEILLPTLSLLLICLFSAAALAVVNAVTHERIAEHDRESANGAREGIFPGARFEDLGAYFAAYDPNGALLGYCVDGEAKGYGGPILVTVGLDTQGNVAKVLVVSCDEETPGLGQKVREESFLRQFEGVHAFFGISKAQTSSKKAIDAVASATYSSQGVADAVNRAIQIYDEQIDAGGEAG